MQITSLPFRISSYSSNCVTLTATVKHSKRHSSTPKLIHLHPCTFEVSDRRRNSPIWVHVYAIRTPSRQHDAGATSHHVQATYRDFQTAQVSSSFVRSFSRFRYHIGSLRRIIACRSAI